jgi:hypothetical protein
MESDHRLHFGVLENSTKLELLIRSVINPYKHLINILEYWSIGVKRKLILLGIKSFLSFINIGVAPPKTPTPLLQILIGLSFLTWLFNFLFQIAVGPHIKRSVSVDAKWVG